MPTFRNIETGATINVKERWAGKLRTQPHLVEQSPEGADIPSEPQPVAETDPALKSLRLADLQALAESRGLPTYGSKAQIIARLGDIEPAAGDVGSSLPLPGGSDTTPEE